MQVLPGKQGIKEAYKLTLLSKKIDTICFSNSYAEVIGDYFDNTYQRELRSKKIKVREILNGQGISSLDQDSSLQSLYLGTKATETDLIVCNDKVVLVSFDKENPFAVVICEPAIVAKFNIVFTKLWDTGK